MSKKALFTIPSVTPRSTFLQEVLTTLYLKQQQSRLWRVRVFAATAALSVMGLVPVVVGLVKALAASNFSTYISLVFSDGSVLASYWKDIAASLVESLPVISLMVTLALVATFLWSLRAMVRFTQPVVRNFSTA